MPIINIKTLPVRDHTNIPELLLKINRTVSETLGCALNHAWSYWEYLKPGLYAVGDHVAAKLHEDSHSPLLYITMMDGYSDDQISKMMEALGRVIATELEIEPSNVFIVINEPRPGMVFAGGEVVKSTEAG